MSYYTNNMVNELNTRLSLLMLHLNDYEPSHYEEYYSCSLEGSYYVWNGKHQYMIVNVSTDGGLANMIKKNYFNDVQFYYNYDNMMYCIARMEDEK